VSIPICNNKLNLWTTQATFSHSWAMDKQTCPVMENRGKPLIDVDDVSFSNGGRPNEQSHTRSWTVSTSVECGCHPWCVVWGKNLGPMMLQINGEMNIQEEELFWCEQYDMVLTYPQFRVSSGAPQNRPKWSLEPRIQYPGAGGPSCLRKLGNYGFISTYNWNWSIIDYYRITLQIVVL